MTPPTVTPPTLVTPRRRFALGGRLDRYVASLFAGSYGVACGLVIGLFLVLDIASNLDDYLREEAGTATPSGWTVLRYYAHELPFLWLKLAPFVTLLAGLFTLSKLIRHRELVACLAAGRSTHRVLLPLFLCAGTLAVSMVAMGEFFTERLGARRDALLDALVERRPFPVHENLWVKDAAGNPIRLGSYEEQEPPVVHQLEATRIAGDPWVEVEALRADWEPATQSWRLVGGRRLFLDELTAPPERVAELEGADPIFGFRPRDVRTVAKSRERPLDLSFSEVRRLAGRDPDNAAWQTLLQVHLTFPMAHIVLLLVGLPLLARQERRQVEGLAAGFLLCVLFYGVDFLFRTLGMRGVLPPLLASWIPVLFFGSLGTVLYAGARS